MVRKRSTLELTRDTMSTSLKPLDLEESKLTDT